MKKLFILFICFVTLFIFTGCNSENYNDYKINIKFIIGARTETIIKEQDEIILIDDIKTINHEHIIGMYYDIDYNNEYNNEPINKDITMYVKVIDGSEYNLEEKTVQEIIDLYYNEYCSSETDKQLVVLKYYFGTYNEGDVVLIINKTKGHPADGRGYQYHIVVYKNNMIIPVEDYLENIEYEDYISILSKSFDLAEGIER